VPGLEGTQANGDVAHRLDVGHVSAHVCPGAEHGLDCTRLLVSSEMAPHVYEHLTGADGQVRDLGSRAIEAMRLEQGLLAWGAEIDANTDPFAAGLGNLVDLARNIPFIGRDAVSALAGGRKRVTCFVHVSLDDPEPMLFGREALHLAGAPVGWLISGAFSHARERAVGIGIVNGADAVAAAERGDDGFEASVALTPVPCCVAVVG
jgi:4-methylaminobutanoate oxidase (formaldehyde-forming)